MQNKISSVRQSEEVLERLMELQHTPTQPKLNSSASKYIPPKKSRLDRYRGSRRVLDILTSKNNTGYVDDREKASSLVQQM